MIARRKMSGDSDVRYRKLSEISKQPMRESCSLHVNKCIYEQLSYPARTGGLEKALIEWANVDSSVLAFCKISENRHDFVRLRYVKEDGLPAFYSTVFLLRTGKAIYLVDESFMNLHVFLHRDTIYRVSSLFDIVHNAVQ